MEPFADYTIQSSAPEELRMISQPPGSEQVQRYRNYVYRSDWRRDRDIYVYHAEIGINKDHVDFRGRRIEWLYTGFARTTGNDKEEESINVRSEYRGHSTCTASKATGILYGAAKNAILVVVKMPDYTYLSWMEVFKTITHDIRAKNRQNNSIVSVSWGSEQARNPFAPREPEWTSLEHQLEDLSVREKVPVVIAAGHSAQERDPRISRPRLEIDTYPAYFVRKGRLSNRVIAASNCDYDGHATKPRRS